MLKRINWPKKISKERILLRIFFWIINGHPILFSLVGTAIHIPWPIRLSWPVHLCEEDRRGSFRRDAHGVVKKNQIHRINPGKWRGNWGCSQRALTSHPLIICYASRVWRKKKSKKGEMKLGKINKCKLDTKISQITNSQFFPRTEKPKITLKD